MSLSTEEEHLFDEEEQQRIKEKNFKMSKPHIRRMQEATIQYMFKDVNLPPRSERLITKLIEMLNCLRVAPGLQETIGVNKIFSTFYTAEKDGDGKRIVDKETAEDRNRGLFVYNPNEESFMDVVRSLIKNSTIDHWEKWQLDLARKEYLKKLRKEGHSEAGIRYSMEIGLKRLKALQKVDREQLVLACNYLKQHDSDNYWVIPFSNALVSIGHKNPNGSVSSVQVRYYIKVDAQGCMTSGNGQMYEREMLLLHIDSMTYEDYNYNSKWRMVPAVYVNGNFKGIEDIQPMDDQGLLPEGAKKFLNSYLGRKMNNV